MEGPGWFGAGAGALRCYATTRQAHQGLQASPHKPRLQVRSFPSPFPAPPTFPVIIKETSSPVSAHHYPEPFFFPPSCFFSLVSIPAEGCAVCLSNPKATRRWTSGKPSFGGARPRHTVALCTLPLPHPHPHPHTDAHSLGTSHPTSLRPNQPCRPPPPTSNGSTSRRRGGLAYGTFRSSVVRTAHRGHRRPH